MRFEYQWFFLNHIYAIKKYNMVSFVIHVEYQGSDIAKKINI